MTPETLFADLAERLATARTRYLLGEHEKAQLLLQGVRIDYLRYREVLRELPGHAALVHSLETAGRAMKP